MRFSRRATRKVSTRQSSLPVISQEKSMGINSHFGNRKRAHPDCLQEQNMPHQGKRDSPASSRDGKPESIRVPSCGRHGKTKAPASLSCPLVPVTSADTAASFASGSGSQQSRLLANPLSLSSQLPMKYSVVSQLDREDLSARGTMRRFQLLRHPAPSSAVFSRRGRTKYPLWQASLGGSF